MTFENEWSNDRFRHEQFEFVNKTVSEYNSRNYVLRYRFETHKTVWFHGNDPSVLVPFGLRFVHGWIQSFRCRLQPQSLIRESALVPGRHYLEPAMTICRKVLVNEVIPYWNSSWLGTCAHPDTRVTSRPEKEISGADGGRRYPVKNMVFDTILICAIFL